MQAQQFIECNGYVVEVIRSNRRKTADLRVEEGAVSIVVPQDTAADKIKQVLQSKRGWITQKLAAQREIMPASGRQYVSGEALPYLGRNYRLKVESGHLIPINQLWCAMLSYAGTSDMLKKSCQKRLNATQS
jgi:predicted metal-dependent hydrolase